MFRLVLLGSTLAMLPLLAQEETPPYHSEATVQMFGSFVTSDVAVGVRGETASGGVLATYLYGFNAYTGIEANYGYTTDTVNTPVSTGIDRIRAASDEASAALVLREPWHRFSPFALIGEGALIFVPDDVPGALMVTKPAFLYGGGVDVKFSNRFFMRAEYRGLLYTEPSFGIQALEGIVNRGEPSLGFGFRF